MTGICIPESMAKMGGTFGCKVVVRKDIDGAKQISFEKKTLLDLISEFFSSAEVIRKSRATAVQALRQIATQLKDPADSQLNKLVAGYETNNETLNFKEIRNAIRISCAAREIILPPAVYEVGNDVNVDYDEFVNYKGVPERKQKQDAAGRDSDIYRAPDYRDRDDFDDSVSEDTSTLEGPGRTGLPSFSNTREQFEEIYRFRLGASIREKTYRIEMVRDPDGRVSDDNLAALAETIVEVERLTKTPFSVSLDGNDDEEFRVLSGKLDSAFVDYLSEHGNPYAREPEHDIGKIKAEISEMQRQYGNAPLRF